MHQRIVEPLIRIYGAFRVRQLILEMEGCEPRTLEVCHLTLADDPSQEIPLKTIHNSRTDLPWVVYAVEEYLKELEWKIHYLEEQLKKQPQLQGKAKLRDPKQWELMNDHYQFVSEALQTLKASHAEDIPDLSAEIRAEREKQTQNIKEGLKEARLWWRQEMQYQAGYGPILGELIFQAGPFHVYESFGFFTPTDATLLPPQQREDGTLVNSGYVIRYQDDVLGSLEIRPIISLHTPDIALLCKSVYSWLDIRRRHNEALLNAIDKKPDPAKDQLRQHWQDWLVWQQEQYQAVYDAWMALGCTDAPTDDPDPVFDPFAAAVFGADHLDTEEP